MTLFCCLCPVALPDSRPCTAAVTYALTARRGFISSLVSDETGKGVAGCPWVVKARPGQRVNFTLWDFGGASIAEDDVTASLPVSSVQQPGGTCQAYAVLTERNTDRRWTVSVATVYVGLYF